MAKQITLVILAFLILSSGAEAKRKKSGSGTIKDGIYTDAKHGFQINLLEGWKGEAGKKSANLRLITSDKEMEDTQRKQNKVPKANPVLGVPTAAIFVFETDLSPAALIDSVLALDGKSEQRKEVLKQTSPSKKYDCVDSLVTQLKKDTEVDGRPGKLWAGSIGYHPCRYTPEEMEKTAQQLGMKPVPRFYGAVFVSTRLDEKHVLVLAAHCDRRLLKETRLDVTELIKTFKWAGEGK
ncbi:MAG: hypothetical protein KAW61_02920 [candidate division Zixibacteria bacterium]|nr:hypothetical protein [candidate division Zixibacteria bacterium]